jgi:DNA-binding NarL/FixJ family response regulator
MSDTPKFKVETDLLTKKEGQVYSLLIQGMTKKAIALQLHRSIKTIEKHIDTIYKKLGVHSAAAAVHIGYLSKIIKLLSLALILFAPLIHNIYFISDSDFRG